MIGLIKKGIGGFYYVETDKGLIEAKGRGILKKDGITLMVGDNVEISIIDEPEKKGVIEAILPRKNQFIRPPIANVDIFAIVFAPQKPKPNFALIDKFLIMAKMKGAEAIICINKCDLASEDEIAEIKAMYAPVYPVLEISAKTGKGINALENEISGKRVALAGPSGVGKSTILNSMIPHANMETGSISEKTQRGKHTTRHVEIFDAYKDAKVFDTPGFTSFEILEAEEDNLQAYYPEFEPYAGSCRYDNCKHIKEPGCTVQKAVSDGRIHPKRYDSYVSNMEEIRKRKKY